MCRQIMRRAPGQCCAGRDLESGSPVASSRMRADRADEVTGRKNGGGNVRASNVSPAHWPCPCIERSRTARRNGCGELPNESRSIRVSLGSKARHRELRSRTKWPELSRTTSPDAHRAHAVSTRLKDQAV